MRPNVNNSEQGKIEAFEDHLDSIYWEGYASWLKSKDREAYDWYYCEFAESHFQAA